MLQCQRIIVLLLCCLYHRPVHGDTAPCASAVSSTLVLSALADILLYVHIHEALLWSVWAPHVYCRCHWTLPFCIGIYRREGWEVPLGAALLELRECASRLKLQEVYISLTISTCWQLCGTGANKYC